MLNYYSKKHDDYYAAGGTVDVGEHENNRKHQ